MQNRRTFMASLAFGATALAVGSSRAQNTATNEIAAGIKFSGNKPLRIMQVTDMHYLPSDKRSEVVDQMIEKGLKEDKPDLIIFTGDNITNAGYREGWAHLAEIIRKYNTPFAAVLGNHDHEGKFSRKDIITYVSTLPGSITHPGPENLAGCGNYVIPVYSPDGKTLRYALFCLDSLAYAPNDLRKQKKVGQYAWFTPGQVDWVREQFDALKKQNGGKPVPALAFFHIPLPEYNPAWDAKEKEAFKPVGKKNENICCPTVNSGMFCAFLESRSTLGCFVGHDHDNDYLGKVNGIALAYGRFTGGSNTYRHWDNGVRLIDLSPGKPEFTTFTHTRGGTYGEKVTHGLG